MSTKYKAIIKLAVVGMIAFYSWKKYDRMSKALSQIPVAGKLFK